ncbi:MAG: hypothetical protein F9K37_10040, partial [Bacteroidales bacterium]
FKAIGLSILLCSALTNRVFSQTDTEFWFSIPEMNRYHAGATGNTDWKNNGTPVYLHLTSFDIEANVTISMPANSAYFTPINVSIPAYTTIRVDLSSYVQGYPNTADPFRYTSMENVLFWTSSNTAAVKPYINKNNKGILIESDNNITAYYEIGVLYNMDLISLKGKNALGQKFVVPFQTTNNTRNYPFYFRPYSSIDILATEDDTKIRIYAPKPIWVKGEGSKPTGWHTIWLNKGETAIITPYANNGYNEATGYYNTSFSKDDRLSGAIVEVDQTEGSGGPISIISHDDVVSSNFSSNPDYVADQLVPIDHTGTEYAVIQGVGYSPTEIEDWIYVLGTMDVTNVSVKMGPAGVSSNYTIGTGETAAISMNNADYKVASIKSDKPIYVYHMSGTGRQKAGAIIPTISNCTGSTRIAFNRTKPNPYMFYLNIMVWQTGMGRFRLLKNNQDVYTPAELSVINAINNAANFNSLPETGAPFDSWKYARIDASVLDANVAYLLVNEENVFHLGVLNGYTANDAFYGYFSNFNQINATANTGEGNNPLIKICYGESTQLYATGGAKYSWSPITFLDDPNIHNPNVISPTVTTKYTVTAQGVCNLTSTADVTVNVSEPLIPSFIADTLSGCGNLTVNFTNTSEGNVRRLYWYVKNDGDSDPGTLVKTANLEINPTDNGLVYNFANSGIEPQNFVVNLLVDAESCQKVVSKSITVYPHIDINPEVLDIFNPNGCNPLTVTLRANPIGNYGDATFLWSFGDGGTSADQNPTHVYNNLTSVPTTFTANVTLTDQWHYCSITKPINVTVQPYIKASFVVDVVEGCSPLNNISIINDSKGGVTAYEWDKDGNGTYEFSGGGNWLFSRANDNIPANTPDVVTLSLRVRNSGGCTDVATRTITINPRATADLTHTIVGDPACAPLVVNFHANTTNSNIYHWMIDGTAVDNVTSTSYIFDNYSSAPIIKTATFTADNQWGCSASASPINITVNPFVQAVLAIDHNEGCSPHTAVMTNASSPGSSVFEWDVLNDGNIDFIAKNIATQTYTYPAGMNNSFVPYSVPVKLTARNIAGCTDVAIQTITVKPQATVEFLYDLNGNTNACSPVDVNFNGTYTNAEFYQWQFGDLGASTAEDPFFQLVNTSSVVKAVQVDLVASNRFECNSQVASQIINVQPFIKANIAIDKVEGCSPFTANINNNSRGPISHFSWDKDGDGNFETHGGAAEWMFFQENTSSTSKILDLGLVVYNEGGCSSTVNRRITVNPNPNVNLGNDRVICKGEYTLLDAGNSGSFFEWSTGATTQVINEKEAGTYSVTVTNEYECTSTDELNIIIDEPTTITAQPASTSKCIGDNATFSIAATGTNINYQWQKNGVDLASATSSTFTINNVNKSDEGTYTCIISSECNEVLSESANLIVEEEPTIVSISPDKSVELGNSLALNINATGDNLIFQWYKEGIPLIDNSDIQGSSTNSLLISAVKLSDSGNYTCTITNECNTITSNGIAINVYEIPVVNLGEDKEICQGESLILDAKNEGATYLWSSGETSQTILVSSSGNYSVTVTNSYGYQSSDDFTLTVNPLPSVILGDNKTVCQGQSVTLDAGNEGATFLWSNGATTKTLTVFEQGNYSVSVTDQKGCSNSDEIQLTVNPLPVVNLGSDKAICEGQSLTLDADNDGATYLWSNGATSKTIVVSEQDTYSVTVTDNNSCSNSDQIQVTVYPLPSINIGDDTQYASTPLTLDPGPNFLSYQWQDGSTNRTYTVNETGLYSVTVTDINGCVGSDNVYVIWEQIQDII